MKIEIEISDEVYKLLEREAGERKQDVNKFCQVAICFTIWDAEVKRRKKDRK